MKRIVCLLVGLVFFAVSSSASAHELTRKEKSFSVFGGFSADVSHRAYGGVVGMEFKLHQSEHHLVLGLAPRVDILQGQTPITIGANPNIETLFVDATLNLRLRLIAADWLAIVGDLGVGLRTVRHNDAIVDQYRMIEGGTHYSAMISWGVALEFRLSDLFRLSGFYHGGLAFDQLVGLGIEPVKHDRVNHKLGVMLAIFFE